MGVRATVVPHSLTPQPSLSHVIVMPGTIGRLANGGPFVVIHLGPPVASLVVARKLTTS